MPVRKLSYSIHSRIECKIFNLLVNIHVNDKSCVWENIPQAKRNSECRKKFMYYKISLERNCFPEFLWEVEMFSVLLDSIIE